MGLRSWLREKRLHANEDALEVTRDHLWLAPVSQHLMREIERARRRRAHPEKPDPPSEEE